MPSSVHISNKTGILPCTILFYYFHYAKDLCAYVENTGRTDKLKKMIIIIRTQLDHSVFLLPLSDFHRIHVSYGYLYHMTLFF